VHRPGLPRELLERRIDALPAYEHRLHLAPRGWRSPASPLLLLKMINVLGAQGWYYQQIERLARGRPVDPGRGMLRSFLRYWWDDLGRALRMRR